jgi:MraZ protein
VAVFSGHYINRIDRKGRVSVPAAFRAVLGGQNFHGIAAFPTPNDGRSLDCCGADWLEQLGERFAAASNLFQQDYDIAALVTLGAAQQLPFDGEGRVVLPAALIDHAGIFEQAAFIGLGRRFQLWNPKTLEAVMRDARARAPAVLGALNLPPLPGGRP